MTQINDTTYALMDAAAALMDAYCDFERGAHSNDKRARRIAKRFEDFRADEGTAALRAWLTGLAIFAEELWKELPEVATDGTVVWDFEFIPELLLAAVTQGRWGTIPLRPVAYKFVIRRLEEDLKLDCSQLDPAFAQRLRIETQDAILTLKQRLKEGGNA